MKILITGAAGFLGSHLTEKLIELGNDVRVLVHYDSNNNWGWLEHSKYKEKIDFAVGDIRDYDSVFSAMKGVDEVFHLAALIGIPYSYLSPLAYIKTNIEGTYNIVQSARHLNTKNIIITSTSETYGSAQYTPMDEDHPKVGQSPYSATKIGADSHYTSTLYNLKKYKYSFFNEKILVMDASILPPGSYYTTFTTLCLIRELCKKLKF